MHVGGRFLREHASGTIGRAQTKAFMAHPHAQLKENRRFLLPFFAMVYSTWGTGALNGKV